MDIKKLKFGIISFVAAFLLPATLYASKTYSPADVPNVKLGSRESFVSDPQHYLTPQATADINRKLLQLMDSTTVEMAVVIVPSIGDYDDFDFAQELGQKWGIGRDDKSNGLLLLMAIDDRLARIHTGYGLEGIIPDAVAKRIIESAIVPWMRGGRIEQAVESAVDEICERLETPAAVAEIKSEKGERRPGGIDKNIFKRNSAILWQFIGFVIFIMICAAIWQMISTTRLSRKENDYNYGKAMAWRNSLPRMLLFTLLSLGACLPLLLITFWRYRSWRTRKLKCQTCGAKMHRLPEDKDNDYLTSGEDCEEKLGTVDYDVWLCDKCGNMEKFPFIKNQSFYKECPSCHHLAYGLKYDRTLRPATVNAEGEGEKVYECRHCGYSDRRRYKIDRKPDPALLAAGALAAGAAMRGGNSSGGGGFSGGSWGGGSFGGGGASGRW